MYNTKKHKIKFDKSANPHEFPQKRSKINKIIEKNS